jgi:hypothetical protein
MHTKIKLHFTSITQPCQGGQNFLTSDQISGYVFFEQPMNKGGTQHDEDWYYYKSSREAQATG